MEKMDNIKEVKVADQSIEIDPRSKTTADKAFNYIGTAKPELGANAKGEQQGGIPVEMTDPYTSQEVEVKGTRRMRPDKRPVKATLY